MIHRVFWMVFLIQVAGLKVSYGDQSRLRFTLEPVSGSSSVTSPNGSSQGSVGNPNSMLREFLKAQKAEVKKVESKFKNDLKELKKTQNKKRQEWEKSEKDARHKFFDEHPKGAERRVYVRDFFDRRDVFLKQQSDERAQLVLEQEASLLKTKKEQADKLKAFNKELSSGKVPSKDLWPDLK